MAIEIELKDSWKATGNDLDEYEELINKLAAATHFQRVKPDELKFYYRLENPVSTGAYKIVVIDGQNLFDFEQKLALYKTGSQAVPIMPVGALAKTKVCEELAEESFGSVGFMMALENGRGIYVSPNAKTTLCMRAKLAGDRCMRKSLYLTQAIAESLSEQQAEITMIVREGVVDGRKATKAFAFMSGKYTDIPLSILPQSVHTLMEDGTLGECKVTGWYVDHLFTELFCEFPKAGEDFAAMEGLVDTVVPGLTLMSSDVGSSSLIIRGTYRVPGHARPVIVDEYAHKHSGAVTPEDVLNACQDEIMANFRRLPEALAAKMGSIIGTGQVSTVKEQNANQKAVEEALKQAMKDLGLKKDLGLQRTKEILEQLNAEIDPECVYSEYDLAMLFLGLPDRIDGLSKEMQNRIAKDCGKAPFIKYGKRKKADEAVILLPEE